MMKFVVYLSIMFSLIAADIFSVNFGFFQLSIYRACIMFAVFIMLIEILMTNKSICIRSRKENSYSIKFMLVWLLYAFFTLVWVKDYGSWIKAVYFLGLGFICIIIFTKYLRDKSDILRAFCLMTVMAIFHNLMGWYEITTGNYLFLSLDRISQYLRNNYPVSMFGNTNDFATFMLFSIFITYICLINSKKFILKLVYTATIISSISLLIMTGSRANILGLILASVVFVFFSMHNKRTRRTLIITLLFGFIVILLRPELLSNLFLMIDENLYFRFSEQVGSDAVRINLIKNGLLFLLATFGFGTGAGNIEYWMANNAVYSTTGILNIHNWWMEILVGYGLIVFMMYIVFYTKLFLSNYKKFKCSNDETDLTISLGIMCCMTGYVIGSISSSSNINSEWLWVFWAIAVAYQGMSYKTV